MSAVPSNEKDLIHGPRLTLVPVLPVHATRLRELRHLPEIARWFHEDVGWPLQGEDGTTRFALFIDDDPERLPDMPRGPVRGFLQYYEAEEPEYRHAGIDIFVDPDLHRQGYGSEALQALAGHLIDVRGHHRLVIDPSTDNAAAIACYASVGFQRVGIMRQYSRRPSEARWADGLLMDLLAAELKRF